MDNPELLFLSFLRKKRDLEKKEFFFHFLYSTPYFILLQQFQ